MTKDPGAARFPSAPPGFVVRVAIGLHRALRRLADRVVPADVAAFNHSVGMVSTALVGAAARHGFADLLAGGPLTSAELAARAGTDPDATHRTLRALAWMGVFALGRDGRFRNNRISRALRSGRLEQTRDWCTYFSSPSNMRAWTDYDHVIATGTNGFAHANGSGVWDWFDAHPDEREGFARAMMGLTTRDAPVIAKMYPWHEVGVVCDVGGGRGTLLSELLIRHPHLNGVLCDGPGVIASARELLAARGVADRVETVAGSFFDRVPAGADAYLMKTVLHDWDDPRAIKILQVVRAAMKPGARLVLAEMLIERDEIALAALADVQMMTVCDEGRERSLADFHRLFAAVGLTPGRVFRYPTACVIEARAE